MFFSVLIWYCLFFVHFGSGCWIFRRWAVIAGRGGGESLQTPKVCANHDCYYALAVDSSQPLPRCCVKEMKIGIGNQYILAQAGTDPALVVPQVIRTPAVQPQNHAGEAGHIDILATLQVRNIQVRAKWDVKNNGDNFTVSALAGDSRQGVLRVGDNIILGAGDYVVTVMAIDEFDYLNESYENLTAMAELTIVAVIEPLRDVGEVVLAVTLIEDVGEAAAYTFAVAGGIAPYSYTFIESQGLSVDAASGVLSYLADGAAPGVYVVAVSADDTAAAIAPIELLLTVEVSAALSAALSDGARDGVHSFVRRTGALPAVELSGVGGIPPYTFTLLENDNFGIDEDGKNFRITAAFTSATVASVVWVLENSDLGLTPAVSGTVQVEIRDYDFEYTVRPPAIVSDIVGEILISGGDADGTYSAGATPTFDPKASGGVTVDVQAKGNSAVVLLDAQIRVNAKYVPSGGANPATGEWIFFSAQEIATLVSLNAEFKGGFIGFTDITGEDLAEAFSTPGMVAIIIGSAGNYEDIVSQVRYVGCYVFEVFGYRTYNCRIRQPTLLSATLSEGARDGVHSFVKWTGVVPGLELSGVGGIPPYTFTLLANDNFGIDEDGKNFRITAAFTNATVVSVVWVLEDSNPGTPAVSGTVEVEVSVPPPLSVALSEGARDGVHSLVRRTGVLSAVELSGVGGIPPYTFTLLANDNFGIDEDGKNFRITAAFTSATVVSVVWVLEDSNPGTPAVSGTVEVEVSVPPTLSVALSDGARDGVHSFVHLKGVLSAVELSGAGGIPPYTFTLLANDNFGIDEDGKNFRITAEFASATVVSVVWVLNDSDLGLTPAVSGTVQVEIRDDGFEYIVRPPAMVRDIVGEILISGGDADGTYSTGETLTFDPNIGGVTVDVQADGNSAVVLLDNAQIRVSANYKGNNPATGEWIFFSAREIAELVSLNAVPDFKGEHIGFNDATELAEAFSTPGMVAIIIGRSDSYEDIVSQVRYVGCHAFEAFGSRTYNCVIRQPTVSARYIPVGFLNPALGNRFSLAPARLQMASL